MLMTANLVGFVLPMDAVKYLLSELFGTLQGTSRFLLLLAVV